MIPTLVYKSPGDHFGPEGKTYSYVALIEAVSPKGPAIPDDNAPPMRVELEEKADQLGLKFDGRTSDNKLSQKIEDALGA